MSSRRSCGISGLQDSVKTGSQSPVEPSECVGQHKGQDKNAGPKHKHVLGLAQIEAADTADQ